MGWGRGGERVGEASKRLGAEGEAEAARHLRGLGYRVLRKNLRTRAGEVDLLCETPDGRTLVVVEVKTRAAGSGARGPSSPPERNVGAEKRARLVAMARSITRSGRWRGRPVRIDVVAIEVGGSRGEPVVRHHVDAVRASR